jgi:hypothetical protein
VLEIPVVFWKFIGGPFQVSTRARVHRKSFKKRRLAEDGLLTKELITFLR